MSDVGLDGPKIQVNKEALELAEQRQRRSFSFHRLGFGLLGLFLFLVVWEIASYVYDDSQILPTVQATAQTFWHYQFIDYPLIDGQPLWGHTLVSVRRILVGWGAGVVVGIALGGAMASIRVVRYLFDPLIELTRPLPPLAFIPLFIVWFGIDDTAKVAVIILGVVPILTIATVTALDAVPQELVQASRSLGASPFWALLTVRLRAALPTIITGMRLAMGGAWTSIVAAELNASTSGVGYLINQAGQNLQMSLLISGIVSIAIVGIVFDSLLRLLHRVTDPTSR